MKNRMIAVLCLVGIVVLVLIIALSHQKYEGERSAEMADLMGMYDAEMAARVTWKDAVPEQSVSYWYDADGFVLMSANEPKPESRGLGTSFSGGAVEDFEAQTGKHYAYDERADYRDKVIRVEVSSSDGNLDVKVDWETAE